MEAEAHALKGIGVSIEPLRIPALERDFALDVFNRLHVMEMKPAFREATKGRPENELYMMAKYMLSLPDTSMEDSDFAFERFVCFEQLASRFRVATDVLVCRSK